LEAYTSLLLVSKETLEEFYGKPVIVADREMVEMVRTTLATEKKQRLWSLRQCLSEF
jgi:diphthamide biosynthesis methyltransferase